jgi:hypothetical protein
MPVRPGRPSGGPQLTGALTCHEPVQVLGRRPVRTGLKASYHANEQRYHGDEGRTETEVDAGKSSAIKGDDDRGRN